LWITNIVYKICNLGVIIKNKKYFSYFVLITFLFVGMCVADEQQGSISFGFKLDTSISLNICVEGGKASFVVVYLDELPDALSEVAKSKFAQTIQKINNTSRTVFYFYSGDGEPGIKRACDFFRIKYWQTIYRRAKPRRFGSVVPQRITLDELSEYFNWRVNILLYTGAGISTAAQIPGQKELIELLGVVTIRDGTKVLNQFLSDCLKKPKKLEQTASDFYKSLKEAEPTGAHMAILKILYKTECCGIITENLDDLHYKTGIDVCVADTYKLSKEQLQMTGVIVCCGLSSDERGLLSLYKKHNPIGVIVSIDIVQPSYLGPGDYLLQGDAQVVLPDLSDLIIDQKRKGRQRHPFLFK
jgi:hypothetical protein